MKYLIILVIFCLIIGCLSIASIVISNKKKDSFKTTGCKATGAWSRQDTISKWCDQNCPTNCPPDMCDCSGSHPTPGPPSPGPPGPPDPGPSKCVPVWGQCGGKNYSGSTQCCSGSVCNNKQSQWYSQCIPTPPPAPVQRWNCDNGKCTSNPNGTYANLDVCDSACEVYTPFKCVVEKETNRHQCVPTSGSGIGIYTSIDQCRKMCPPPQPSPPPQPPVPSGKWDYAYFYSGGDGGVYTTDDLGREAVSLTGNPPNGADPSCGAADPSTMGKCVTNPGAKTKYNVQYGNAYQSAVENNYCDKGSCCISLVNQPSGKVAALEHGPFGAPLGTATCTTGHYDKYTNPTIFNKRRDKLNYILKKCGCDKNGYTSIHKNGNGTESCLISTKAFKNAGIKLPDEEGEEPVSNNGIAISWGHGVGSGGCGAVSLLQQGKSIPGGQIHKNPGNTTINFQVGTRAWSGEWSDTISGTSGYLRDGSNTQVAEAGSQSCLQPRMKVLSGNNFDKLLDTVCDRECVGKPGLCPGKSGCVLAGEGNYGDCGQFTTSSACNLYKPPCPGSHPGWCCKWVDSPSPGPQPPGPPTPSPPGPPTPSPQPSPPLPTTSCNYTWDQVVLTDKTEDQILGLEKKYEKSDGTILDNITFEQIVQAWMDAGMNPALAHYALIIAGGECNRCSLTVGSNTSGILQCDECRGAMSTSSLPPCTDGKFGPKCRLNLKNPVSNIWAAVRTVMFPEKGLNKEYASNNRGCQFANQTNKVCTIQPNQKGAGNHNFIGPFCHKQYSPGSPPQQIDEPGGAWNGGGNVGQTDFPDYYYQLFLTNLGQNIPPDSNKLKNKAETLAKQCVAGKCPDPVDPSGPGSGATCIYQAKKYNCYPGSSGSCISLNSKVCYNKVGGVCTAGTVECEGGPSPGSGPVPDPASSWPTPKYGDDGVTYPVPVGSSKYSIQMAWVATCYIESLTKVNNIKQLPFLKNGEQLNGVTAFAVTPTALLSIKNKNADITDSGKNNLWPIAFSKTNVFKDNNIIHKWLCIGGGGYRWQPDDFHPTNVKQYVAFCKYHGYTGIQLDIETGNITHAMIENCLLWMKALGMTTSITPSWLPGNQAPPMPTIWYNLDWTYCDYIVTQLYAASGLWDGDNDLEARRKNLAQAWYTHKDAPAQPKSDGVAFCSGSNTNTLPWTGIQQCAKNPFQPIINNNSSSFQDKIIQGIPIKKKDGTTIIYNDVNSIDKYSTNNKTCFWIIGNGNGNINWTGGSTS